MTKTPADLMNAKPKGRFRRLRRQEQTAVKNGASLSSSVVDPTSIGPDRTLVRTMDRRKLTKAQLAQHYWRCQDGRVLAITEMRDAHLLNTMDLLTRMRNTRHAKAVSQQSVSHDASLEHARGSARCAQWLLVMEAELLRRHPDYLERPKIAPTGLELYAVKDFFTGGVLAPVEA